MQGNEYDTFLSTKVAQFELKDFSLGEIIGRGSFAKVRISKNLNNNKFYAVKEMKKIQLIKLQQVDHIYNEIKILNSLDHKFIVKFHGIMQDEKKIYIIQELVNGGELFTYLRAMRKLDRETTQFYSAQILLIIEYLHSKNIIYRDLKPENVLIDKSGYLKLCDFGFAKVCDFRTYTLCGTPDYLAPEILLNKGHGKPADWWTFGVFLYELKRGITPFADDSPLNVYKKILAGKVFFPKEFDKDAKKLIRHLIQPDLSKRYGNLTGGVWDIKNSSFFYEIDFLTLYSGIPKAPYYPRIESVNDIRNFEMYPDSLKECDSVSRTNDPFHNW